MKAKVTQIHKMQIIQLSLIVYLIVNHWDVDFQFRIFGVDIVVKSILILFEKA